MSALKRLHEMQQKSRAGKAAHVNGQPEESPSKRLKSSHNTPSKDTFAAILDTSSARRKQLSAATTNGLPSKAANKIDETRATVAAGANDVSDAISISSDEESDNDESDEEKESQTNGVHQSNGIESNGQAMVPLEDVEMSNGAEEDEEPSFGDMLKSRHPDIIDVHAHLPDPHAEPPHLVPASGKGALLRPVTGHSLATVLQQALKTNDKDMLESCFHLRDVQAIRNTIQRLPSPLVGNLLSRISERIYKRPGRTGTLMLWIQWSLVAHGGYLSTQPDILRKLKALNQVVRQRAQGLQPLVQLKAKLDMLSAQLELRRGMQNQRLRADAAAEEDGVLYIEANDDAEADLPSDDDEVLAIEAAPGAESDDEADDLNLVQQEDSDEEEDAIEEDMLDIEAEETDDDSADEDENDDSEDVSEDAVALDDGSSDEESSEEEEEEEVKAPRPQTLNRKR
ncbi:hypothetical protein AMS68_003392 [Peltaster fructicola]|uniref:Small-subunit processome Utp12 domain-containing protein n=1 Tax=Peltaster fructicola TaxID=286661 RepID=A0A6H0XTA6_9PEZI|nr:hypothetical protein AMS68_003392 [Peltaster fructicola]